MATNILSRQESRRQRDLMSVERAVEAALPLAKPGHLFTHQWLEEQLGLGPAPADGDARDRWKTRKLTLVDMWREAMGGRPPHIHTDNSHAKGYVVVPPSDSIPLLQRQTFNAVGKSLRQGRNRMEVWVDPAALTPQQRQERIDAMGRVALMEHALRQARPRPPKLPMPPVRMLTAPQADAE